VTAVESTLFDVVVYHLAFLSSVPADVVELLINSLQFMCYLLHVFCTVVFHLQSCYMVVKILVFEMAFKTLVS